MGCLGVEQEYGATPLYVRREVREREREQCVLEYMLCAVRAGACCV